MKLEEAIVFLLASPGRRMKTEQIARGLFLDFLKNLYLSCAA